MSPRRDIVVEEPPPPHWKSVAWLFHNPQLRMLTVTGLGALGMIFALMFLEGGPLGGLLLALIGAAGLLLRWTGAPVFFFFVLVWFLIFPTGIPPADDREWDIARSHLRMNDLAMVTAVVVYLACQYRLFGFGVQSMPTDGGLSHKGEKPPRRPPELIRPSEIAWVLATALGVVLIGQLVWWFGTSTRLDAGEAVPVQWAEDDTGKYKRADPSDQYGTSTGRKYLPAGAPGRTAMEPAEWAFGRYRPAGAESFDRAAHRFVLIAGVMIFTALLARLVFGYWRLRTMGAAEAAMILQETAWDETRREPDRLAKWKATVKVRTEARAKQLRGEKP